MATLLQIFRFVFLLEKEKKKPHQWPFVGVIALARFSFQDERERQESDREEIFRDLL